MTFEDAIEVFDDPYELTKRSQFGEESRFETIGRVRETVFFIVYTIRSRDDGLFTRIISARAASREERARYERQ